MGEVSDMLLSSKWFPSSRLTSSEHNGVINNNITSDNACLVRHGSKAFAGVMASCVSKGLL